MTAERIDMDAHPLVHGLMERLQAALGAYFESVAQVIPNSSVIVGNEAHMAMCQMAFALGLGVGLNDQTSALLHLDSMTKQDHTNSLRQYIDFVAAPAPLSDHIEGTNP